MFDTEGYRIPQHFQHWTTFCLLRTPYYIKTQHITEVWLELLDVLS